MALLRLRDNVLNDPAQSISVARVATVVGFNSTVNPFITHNAGDNSLRVDINAVFAMQWRGQVFVNDNTVSVITEGAIDTGATYKPNSQYYLYVVDKDENGAFVISENPSHPSQTPSADVLRIARFQTNENASVDPSTLVDFRQEQVYISSRATPPTLDVYEAKAVATASTNHPFTWFNGLSFTKNGQPDDDISVENGNLRFKNHRPSLITFILSSVANGTAGQTYSIQYRMTWDATLGTIASNEVQAALFLHNTTSSPPGAYGNSHAPITFLFNKDSRLWTQGIYAYSSGVVSAQSGGSLIVIRQYIDVGDFRDVPPTSGIIPQVDGFMENRSMFSKLK